MKTPKTPKTRLAVMIDAPKLDTTYGASGGFWELSIVRVDSANGSPLNCDRDSWERPEERIFEDMAIRCYVSWFDGKFAAQQFNVEYKGVYSVDLNCVKILSAGLQRASKIIESFPVRPESFGQFACLLAAGLGVKEMIRKSPHYTERQRGSLYSDYQWQILPVSSAQNVIDELLNAAREKMFPVLSTDAA